MARPQESSLLPVPRWRIVLTAARVMPIIPAIYSREMPSGLTKYAAEPFGARMIPPGTPAQGSPYSFVGRIHRWPIA